AELLDERAVGLELQDVAVVAAVAANPDVALRVRRDAVVRFRPFIRRARLRAAPRAHQVAFLIELEHRRRGQAALGLGRVGEGVNLLRLERAGAAMNDVDVILLVDADADDVAHHPVIRERLRPHRVDFEARRLRAGLGLGGRGLLEHLLRDAKRGEQHEQRQPDEKRTSPPHSLNLHPERRQYTTGVHGIKHALWVVFAVFLLVWAAATPAAHDIPNDVTVQAFIKPDGQHLRLVMRVPLGAMRDMDYPKPRGRTNADLLDLERADQSLRDAATLWLSDFLDLYENDRPLGAPQIASVRAALQSDRSFAGYDEALAHVTGPRLPETTEFFWSQGLLDVLFEYPIQSDRSKFSIRPRLGRLGIRTLTILRFLPPDGSVRSFEFYGDPGLVRLDPTLRQAAFQFLELGFFHILDGVDHLLFLACLVIQFRRFGPLAAVVTAFTVAHSITLIAAAYNLAPDALWFPPLIE